MWIHVHDRLPEEGKLVDVWRYGQGRVANCVLVGMDYYTPMFYTVRPDRPSDRIYQRHSFVGGSRITHWRELPLSPEEEPKSNEASSREITERLQMLVAHADRYGLKDREPLELHVDMGSAWLTMGDARELLKGIGIDAPTGKDL